MKIKLSQLCISAIILLCAISCQSYKYKNDIKEKHDKYRTLWYRTGEQCFYDSCRKYGLLYDSVLGISQDKYNWPDTVAVDEPAVCK